MSKDAETSSGHSTRLPSTDLPTRDIEKAPVVPSNTNPSEWDGPDDPDNPMNWSKWRKIFMVVAPALISFTGTLGSSIYTPAISEIQESFRVSETVAILPLSLYVLALGFGPIIAAPLSESYGRHVVYLISPILAALFTIGAGASNNITALCICRLFAGLFFSPSLAIGAGTISDVYLPKYRAIPSSLYITSPFLGPGLGPVIGSFVAVRKSWRWTQWTLIFFAIFSWINILFMSESYKKTILAHRAHKRGIIPPPGPKPLAYAKTKFLLTVILFRPIHMIFTEPIVASLSVYIAFNFSVLFSFFAAFPYVFTRVYGFNTEQNGLVFIAIAIGCLLAMLMAIVIDKTVYQKEARKAEEKGVRVRVEHRLYGAMLGSVGLPIGLFWFAWSARSDVSWASPVVAAIPFAWGNLSIFIAGAMYLIDCYQSLNGASAMAANGLLRYGFGAAFPLFTLQMYEKLGIGWATSLLGFISVAMLPVPWIIFRFGESLRAKSSYKVV